MPTGKLKATVELWRTLPVTDPLWTAVARATVAASTRRAGVCQQYAANFHTQA